MSKMLEALDAWGCDVNGAMERMTDDEEFYAECLRDVANDPYFAVLKDALKSGNRSAAFTAAHTLKGVLANVGLTPMYQKVVEIVEPLRAGRPDDLTSAYNELMQMKEKLEAILTQSDD